MQVQLEVFSRNCFYPFLLKFSTIAFLNPPGSPPGVFPLLPCFLLSSIQFSRCTRVLNVPSKLNNERKMKRSDLGFHKTFVSYGLLRKEVIQPLVLERLPCYDFTPITKPTFGRVPLAVRLRTSGVPSSHGVTGGVYKARERIHRGMLIRDY